MSWLKRNSLAIISTSCIAYSIYQLHSYFHRQNQNNLLPALTESETLEIVENLRDRYKNALMEISKEAQHYQMMLAQQGQQVSEEQLLKHLLPKLESKFMSQEAKVYDSFDIESEEFEEAYNVYTSCTYNNKEIKAVAKEMQDLYNSLNGMNTSDGSDMIPPETMVTLLNDLLIYGTTNCAIDNYVKVFFKENGKFSESNSNEFNIGLMQLLDNAISCTCQQFNFTKSDFEQSLQYYSSSGLNQEVCLAFQYYQKKQQEYLGSVVAELMQ